MNKYYWESVAFFFPILLVVSSCWGPMHGPTALFVYFVTLASVCIALNFCWIGGFDNINHQLHSTYKMYKEMAKYLLLGGVIAILMALVTLANSEVKQTTAN
jgi:hypothetical protein